MTGLTNYSAGNVSAYLSARAPTPLLPAIWVALFTAVGTDAGTGFTEVTGGSYARVQIAGQLAAGASFTTASTTITLGSSAPAWLLALGTSGSGVNVYDVTNSKQIGTVSSISGTTVTLTTTAANNSSGSTDNLQFSIFPASSGTAPSTDVNAASFSFVTATASWGTVIGVGFYDAVTSGNLLEWDFLGNDPWVPFSCTAASPGILTAIGITANSAPALANGAAVVMTSEYGGTLPTGFTQYTVYTVAGLSADTFNLGTNTSSTGSGAVRQIAQLVVSNGVTFSFAANSITLSFA